MAIFYIISAAVLFLSGCGLIMAGKNIGGNLSILGALLAAVSAYNSYSINEPVTAQGLYSFAIFWPALVVASVLGLVAAKFPATLIGKAAKIITIAILGLFGILVAIGFLSTI